MMMQRAFNYARLIRLRGAGYPILLLAVLALFPGCEKQFGTSLSKDEVPPAEAFWSARMPVSSWTPTAAAQMSGEGEAFAGAMSIKSGVWFYQLTDDGLAAELTAKGTKYYKDENLN